METPDQRPRNPIYPWLRVMLWILPAGFLVISAMGMAVAANILHMNSALSRVVWLVLNALFVIGTGWCDYQLASPNRREAFGVGYVLTLYCLCQIFLAPFLLVLLALIVLAFAR